MRDNISQTVPTTPATSASWNLVSLGAALAGFFAAVALAAFLGLYFTHEAWTQDWKILVRFGDSGQPVADLEGAWYPGEMTPEKFGDRPAYEPGQPHRGILKLHPINVEQPAKLLFTGRIPPERPLLVVEAGGHVAGDCLLQCVVNGTKIGEYTLTGKGWTRCTFDLSPYTQQEVTLELWDKAGGSAPWAWEHAFIDQITFEPIHDR